MTCASSFIAHLPHVILGVGFARPGQHEDIVSGAVMYLKLSAPALWCYVMAECLKRYLLAQVAYDTQYLSSSGCVRAHVFV